MIHYGVVWVWEDGRFVPWPPPGAYGTRTWEPIDKVAASLRTLAQLLHMKGTTQRVQVDQAAWVKRGSGWQWVKGPSLSGEAGVMGQALAAHVAKAATWAAA